MERLTGPYKIICVARNPITGQDFVVYRADGGQPWCCTVGDFAVKMVAVKEYPDPVPEKPCPMKGSASVFA